MVTKLNIEIARVAVGIILALFISISFWATLAAVVTKYLFAVPELQAWLFGGLPMGILVAIVVLIYREKIGLAMHYKYRRDRVR